MAVKNLVALKVIVKLDPTNGQALYPNFNLISSSTRKGMDWSKYIDVHGSGWHYDKTSGHREETVDSPQGEQIACLCVPQDFATEALSSFPSVVTEMTETEFEDFHDNKAHAHEPAESISTDILNGLSAQRNLMVATGKDVTALDAKIGKALDPLDKSEPGVVENKKKMWVDAKATQGIALKNPKAVV
jgi:hypothetical protein